MASQRFIIALGLAAVLCCVAAEEPLVEALKNPERFVVPGYFDASLVPESALGDPSGLGVGGASCNASLFTSCLHRYYAELSIASIPPSAKAFIAILQNIIAQNGRIGLQRICTADTFLYQCLGPVQKGACLNPLQLLSGGDDAADAYTYASLRASLDFQCGAGLMPLLYNFNCIGSTNAAKNTTLQRCNSNYAANVAQDPTNACKYMQQFVNCYGTVFSACNGLSGWTMCESVRVGAASVNLFNCPASCNVGHFSNADGAEVAALASEGRREASVEEALAGPYAHVAEILHAAKDKQEA